MAVPSPLPPAPPRRAAARHLLALPSVVWTVAFFGAPLALLVFYSFGSLDLLTFDVTFGWTTVNYTQIVDPLYLETVLRSFALSIGATVVCLALGLPVALTIARQPPRRQALLLVAIMVPFWTSFVVRTYGLVDLLGDSGPLADALAAIGLAPPGGLRLLYTPWGVVIGMVYAYLPLMVLPLYVALERLDPALPQAAADLGASPSHVLRRVILPLARPGIIAGCVLVGVPSTGEYVVPAILGGDKTLLYGNLVANQLLGVGNYPFGAALAVALVGVVGGVLLLTRTSRREATA